MLRECNMYQRPDMPRPRYLPANAGQAPRGIAAQESGDGGPVGLSRLRRCPSPAV